MRGGSLLFPAYKYRSEGLVTISVRVGSLLIRCLILVFDLLVFSYSVPSPSLHYIFWQVPHLYSTKVFSASTALHCSYPTRRKVEVRREMEEQVPFGFFENITFYGILHARACPPLESSNLCRFISTQKERYTMAHLQNRRDPHWLCATRYCAGNTFNSIISKSLLFGGNALSLGAKFNIFCCCCCALAR